METRIAGHDTLLSLCLGCVIAETLTRAALITFHIALLIINELVLQMWPVRPI